jgi:hypothetical protein
MTACGTPYCCIRHIQLLLHLTLPAQVIRTLSQKQVYLCYVNVSIAVRTARA